MWSFFGKKLNPPMIDQLRDEQIKFMERTRVMVVDREQVLTRWQEVIDEQKDDVRLRGGGLNKQRTDQHKRK